MRAVRSIFQVNCQGWQFSARRRRRGSPQEVDGRRGESSQTHLNFNAKQTVYKRAVCFFI